MNRFKKIVPIGFFLLAIVTSCSDDDETGINTTEPPTAAALIFPENNTVCNEGIVISDTETDVFFQWDEATNASSYILQITNLNDGTSRNISTISTEFLIRIFRGTPYSWSVESLGDGTNETAESTTWRFYNAGLPEESHPPFPAQVISPQVGSSIDEGSVTLQWESSDIDNDIISYVIVLDTANPPITEVGDTSNSSLEVTVASGLVYYWKVVTTDAIGNASHSQVFQFGVN